MTTHDIDSYCIGILSHSVFDLDSERNVAFQHFRQNSTKPICLMAIILPESTETTNQTNPTFVEHRKRLTKGSLRGVQKSTSKPFSSYEEVICFKCRRKYKSLLTFKKHSKICKGTYTR